MSDVEVFYSKIKTQLYTKEVNDNNIEKGSPSTK